MRHVRFCREADLLEDKNAIVYGRGGSVASAFAREGANVFLAGRTLATVDKAAMKERCLLGRVTTLADVGNAAALIRGNVAEEVSELKRQPGKDILVFGSGSLVGTPMRTTSSMSTGSWSSP